MGRGRNLALIFAAALALAVAAMPGPAFAQPADGSVSDAAAAARGAAANTLEAPSEEFARGDDDGPADGLSGAEAALAPTDPPDPEEVRRREKEKEVAELCRLLTSAAGKYGVPEDFFIRLIWKESRFNPRAVSPVGAQGIAQFMPGTARLRGLKNPFDREEALFASASFLADLEERLGSWGLAAAGYNGGPNRVPAFVEGAAGLPYETIDYVYSITGRTAEYWASRQRGDAPPAPTIPSDWRRRGDLSPVSAAQGDGEGAPAATAPQELGNGGADDGRATGQDATGGNAAGDLALAASAGTAPVPAASVVRSPDGVAPDAFSADAAIGPGASVEPRERPIYPPPVRPEYAPRPVDCPVLIARLGTSRSITPPRGGGGGGWTAWGAQVAGHPKRAVAMRQYERLKRKLPGDLVAAGPNVVVRRFAARGRLPIHAVQFAAPNKAAAEAICKRIAKSLAPCVVVKNG